VTPDRQIAGGRPAFAIAAVAAALVLMLTGATTALAAPSSLFDTPAADQYVETVPASDGPSAHRGKSAPSAPLPPAARTALEREGGESASQLEEVATSPSYGAPQRKLERHSDSRPPSISAAAVSAIGDDTEGDLRWLLIALLGSTALVIGTAGYRHRQQRKAAR
jgi:hypothetical protein